MQDYSPNEFRKVTSHSGKLADEMIVLSIWSNVSYDDLLMSQVRKIRDLIQRAYERGYADAKSGLFREDAVTGEPINERREVCINAPCEWDKVTKQSL